MSELFESGEMIAECNITTTHILFVLKKRPYFNNTCEFFDSIKRGVEAIGLKHFNIAVLSRDC